MSYARMRGDLVLPTIEDLVGLDLEPTDWTAQMRLKTTASVRRILTAQSIVESSVRHRVDRPVDKPRLAPPPFPRAIVQTVRTRRFTPAVRWPVFACGFFAGIFAGLALLTSPIGHTPGVERFVNAVRITAHSVAHR